MVANKDSLIGEINIATDLHDKLAEGWSEFYACASFLATYHNTSVSEAMLIFLDQLDQFNERFQSFRDLIKVIQEATAKYEKNNSNFILDETQLAVTPFEKKDDD